MNITLTPAQYSALDATEGARKRITAACRPGPGDTIALEVDAEPLASLQATGADTLGEAATMVRWKTLKGGALHCTVKEVKASAAPKANKGETVIAMLQREHGATNAEMMEATGWQTHSVRGFLAGVQMKRLGLKAVRIEREDGTRAYKAEAALAA